MDTQPIALPASAVRRLPHPGLVIVTIAYTSLIGWITLASTESGSAVRQLSRWVIRELAPLPLGVSSTQWEFLLNLGMLVPLGLLLTLLVGARFVWVAALAALALTFSVEQLQQFIPYRVPDPRDLLANGLGGVAGALLGAAGLAIRRHGPSRAPQR